MSHVADVDMVVTDLGALRKACEALGFEFREGQRSFEWYGQWVGDYNDPRFAAATKGVDPKTFGQCDHAIRAHNWQAGDYEIGVCALPEGGYAIRYDFWGPGAKIARALAANASDHADVGLGKLKNEYGAQVSEAYWQTQGYQTSRKVTTDGDLQVVAWTY